MKLHDRDLEEHGALLDQLETALERAHEKSSLPEEPTAVDALNDFVVRIRLEAAAL